jgi:hypothetical protein
MRNGPFGFSDFWQRGRFCMVSDSKILQEINSTPANAKLFASKYYLFSSLIQPLVCMFALHTLACDASIRWNQCSKHDFKKENRKNISIAFVTQSFVQADILGDAHKMWKLKNHVYFSPQWCKCSDICVWCSCYVLQCIASWACCRSVWLKNNLHVIFLFGAWANVTKNCFSYWDRKR